MLKNPSPEFVKHVAKEKTKLRTKWDKSAADSSLCSRGKVAKGTFDV